MRSAYKRVSKAPLTAPETKKTKKRGYLREKEAF